MTSRSYTKEEVRAKFLAYVRNLSQYWSTLPGKTPRERTDGMAFSMLTLLDGGTVLPAFAVEPKPHPDDKAYFQSQDEKWYPDDIDIAGSLHEEFYK